jgi:hypothetical protein
MPGHLKDGGDPIKSWPYFGDSGDVIWLIIEIDEVIDEHGGWPWHLHKVKHKLIRR